MQKLNLTILKRSMLLALGLIVVGCSTNDNETDVQQSNVQNSSLVQKVGKYTGKEIVEGLFFFKNDIANGIPKLKEIKGLIPNNQDPELLKGMTELSELSIKFIEIHYPTFLNELQTTMYSGDLFKIGAALEKTAMYIEQAGLASEKYHTAFALSKAIDENADLRARIEALDLSKASDVDKLRQITIDAGGTAFDPNYRSATVIAAVGALVVVYVGAIAVSIAAVAYSVYFQVAYWGCRCSHSPGATQQLNIFVSGNNLELEREMLIAQVGQFFSPK